eukprot:571080-Pelagomonas_calceolata.AAC.1
MPTWQCEIIIRTVDLMKKTLQPDTSDEVTMLTQMPEVITSECACTCLRGNLESQFFPKL